MRIRIRSRIVRSHVERACIRTIVSVTASRADTKAHYCKGCNRLPDVFLVTWCKINNFLPHSCTQQQFFWKNSPACGGVWIAPPRRLSDALVCQNFKELYFFARLSRCCFRFFASLRFRFIQSPDLPQKSRGATSSAHSHTKPHSTQSRRTRLHSHHC